MLSTLSANVVAVDQALLRSMQVETQNLNSNTRPVISEEISQHLKQQNTSQRQCQVLNLVSTNIDSY
jgi:predicted XRE-type DNA-binding protein